MGPELMPKTGAAKAIGALALLNARSPAKDLKAFYAEDKQCYLRHIRDQDRRDPHRRIHTAILRPGGFKKARAADFLFLDEAQRRMLRRVLLPLFASLAFTGSHLPDPWDKALRVRQGYLDEVPRCPPSTSFISAFQAKKGKLDAAESSKAANVNVPRSTIRSQLMLGHEIFDPELSRRVWWIMPHRGRRRNHQIGEKLAWHKLDARSAVRSCFMDRNDILNLFVVTNLPLPSGAIPAPVS